LRGDGAGRLGDPKKRKACSLIMGGGRHSKTIALLALSALAIIAFAGNSLLARAALADGAIEAGAFSVIRLASGALILLPLMGRKPSWSDMPAALALAIYVAGFSLAYLSLDAGIGALILFACVQATIVSIGYARGDRLSALGWSGLAMAFAGLLTLLAPGFVSGAQPIALASAGLMALAGMAWGAYTVMGRGTDDAAGSTARNFLIASVLVLPMLALDESQPSTDGIILAIVAGALTSGLGYVVWYKVAPQLSLGTVASAQLATPVVAALGGALLLAEPLGWRLLLGGALILGGIVLTLRKARATEEPEAKCS